MPISVNKVSLEHSHTHLLMYCLVLLLHCSDRAEWLQQRSESLQSLKSLLSGTSQKKQAGPGPEQRFSIVHQNHLESSVKYRSPGSTRVSDSEGLRWRWEHVWQIRYKVMLMWLLGDRPLRILGLKAVTDDPAQFSISCNEEGHRRQTLFLIAACTLWSRDPAQAKTSEKGKG